MSNIPQNFSWNTANTPAAKFDGAMPQFRVTTDNRGLLVSISNGRLEPLNNEQGFRVVYDFRGEEGEDMGKVVPVGFNIGHKDITKMQKSAAFFNGFLACVGFAGSMTNPGQINGRRLRVTVVSANNTEFPDNTNVSGYRTEAGTFPGGGQSLTGGQQNGGGGFGTTGTTDPNQGQQQQQNNNANNGWGGNGQGGNVQQQDPNAGQQTQQQNNGGFVQGNFQQNNGGQAGNQGGGNNAPWQ